MQESSILPAWVANHSAGFGSSYPLTELAIITCIIKNSPFCLQYSRSGADPGEVKRVNFHPPFSEPPSFFFLIPQILVLRPRLFGEKLSRVEGSPAYPSYPGRANFSYISLQNLAIRLYEKQKVGSARRVTRLAR